MNPFGSGEMWSGMHENYRKRLSALILDHLKFSQVNSMLMLQ